MRLETCRSFILATLERHNFDLSFQLEGLGDVIAVLNPHHPIHAECFFDAQSYFRRHMGAFIEQRG